jgi:hypothetical protein
MSKSRRSFDFPLRHEIKIFVQIFGAVLLTADNADALHGVTARRLLDRYGRGRRATLCLADGSRHLAIDIPNAEAYITRQSRRTEGEALTQLHIRGGFYPPTSLEN